MNKKLLLISILAVFMLVSISFASAVNSNTAKTVEKKESPLYKIRTRRAIGETLVKIIDYIKSKFLGERIFFLPFQWIRNKIHEDTKASWIILCTYEKTANPCTCGIFCTPSIDICPTVHPVCN